MAELKQVGDGRRIASPGGSCLRTAVGDDSEMLTMVLGQTPLRASLLMGKAVRGANMPIKLLRKVMLLTRILALVC